MEEDCELGRIIDITGNTYGKLTVLNLSEYKGKSNKVVYWTCICECGSVKDYLGTSLRRSEGATKSCGCNPKNKTHGLTNTRLYKILDGMKYRCFNENCNNYHNYGARGIKICDEWIGENGMTKFYEWAIDNGYDDSLSIDRIDNDGDYEPSNCRWVDIKVQSNNKRTNSYHEMNGIVKTISEWSDYSGVYYSTLLKRLEKGMSIEDAINMKITTPMLININNIEKTFKEWSEHSGVEEGKIRKRYANGIRGKLLITNDNLNKGEYND